MPSSIRIDNPGANASGFTTVKAARRYVAQGRGRITPRGTLYLFPSDHRNISASDERAANIAFAERFYDGIDRMMTMDEAGEIPMANPKKAFTRIGQYRDTRRIVYRNGKVRQVAVAL